MPNVDHVVAVSNVTRPVTHTADMAVNIQSIKGGDFSLIDEIGKYSRNPPRIAINKKLAVIQRAGVICEFLEILNILASNLN